MKAIWNNTTIAEAEDKDLIRIEGNWYFPPESLNREFFRDSDHTTTCHWKGLANYYDIVVDDKKNDFGAWYYHTPLEGSIERVGKDFADYVAFWNGVEITS
jgi:uncharacterized protein (DUF427 family)|tara:strand:+ start:1122 stop:1424 length:303 start_codon:yes stop_codon:yes gene_type:complete